MLNEPAHTVTGTGLASASVPGGGAVVDSGGGGCICFDVLAFCASSGTSDGKGRVDDVGDGFRAYFRRANRGTPPTSGGPTIHWSASKPSSSTLKLG